MTGGATSRGRVVVVGGGAVGLAFAAACGEEVRVLEAGAPRPDRDPEPVDIRVFALSQGTRDFLLEIGAWQRLPAERLAPVTRMEVFGDDGTSRLEFAPPAGGALAWIAEGNRLDINATPTVFVNGRKLPRLNDFVAVVDKEARKKGFPPLGQ